MAKHISRLPLLILAVALAVIFHRLLLGEVFFWGLPSLQFYPWREYGFDLLHAGQLPLWNPYNGSGAPLLANYQSALLYPPNWLGLVLPLAWQMSMTAVLHLFIGGWGMWVFTGRLGLPSPGRGISTLAFGMTGYLVARLGTYSTISAAAWLPWLLWAALVILSRPLRRDTGLLAVFAGLQLLAGHAQTTWYSLLLVAAFSAWWSVTNHPIRWSRLLPVTGALVLGAGTAAAQLIPTAELLTQSQRSGGVNYDFAMNFSYAPARILNFLSPVFFGTPADGSYVTQGAFFEDAVYIGLIPLVSALAAVITWGWGKVRRSERPAYFSTVPFWLLVVLVGFTFALGKNMPIFPFLYNNVPTFDLFQAPVRWHLWTVFGLSVLAGIGIGAWGRGYWLFFGTRLAMAACIGAVLLAVFAPRFLPPDAATNEGVQVIIRAVIGIGVLGATAGLLTLAQPENPSDRHYHLWSLAVLVVIAVDLSYAAWGLNPTVPASFYERRSTENSLFTRVYWPEAIEERVRYETFLLFDDYRVALENAEAYRASNLANMNLIDRLPLLNNFDPFLVGSFAQYLELIEKNPAQRDQLLSAAGVNAVYDENGDLQVLDQPAARAWLAEAVCTSNGVNADCPQAALPNGILGEVIRIADTGGAVEVEINNAQDAWLVLADTYYPGWTASADGEIIPIQQANLAFRAVQVSAGTETVRFEYQPWWLWPGILISLTSILLILILFRSRNPDLQ